MKNVTLGADPELFLYSQKEGRYISAIGKIGGSKLEPLFIDDYGHAIQEDNVAVEFNIPPVKTPEQFRDEIKFMLNYLNDIAKKHSCFLSFASHAMFQSDQLEHPQAKTFGCEPDVNVWEMCEQRPPKLPKHLSALRTCGGHIHIGWEDPDIEHQVELGRALDVFVGIETAKLDGISSLRRELYGKAGSVRFKRYGLEYRTPSNGWLASEKFALSVAQGTLEAVEFIRKGNRIDMRDAEQICLSINKSIHTEDDKLRRRYGATMIL